MRKEVNVITEKALYCLGQHFSVLTELAINNEPGCLGTVCNRCKLKNSTSEKRCTDPNYWHEMMVQLKNETGIAPKLCTEK